MSRKFSPNKLKQFQLTKLVTMFVATCASPVHDEVGEVEDDDDDDREVGLEVEEGGGSGDPEHHGGQDGPAEGQEPAGAGDRLLAVADAGDEEAQEAGHDADQGEDSPG